MVNKRQKGAKKAPKGPKGPKLKYPKEETAEELQDRARATLTRAVHQGGRSATKLVPARGVDEEEVFTQVNSTSACHIEKLGTFLLYRFHDRHYYMSLCYSDYDKKMFENANEAFFSCGSIVKRFIALDRHKLMVEFEDFEPLLIVTTKDDWETLEHHREPRSNLKDYLAIKFPKERSLFAALRDTGNKDVTIVCADGVRIDVHSLILAPQWPHFCKTVDLTIQDTQHMMKMMQPSKWIRAMVDFFYDERKPMDLDTACGALVIGQSYDIPQLSSLALKTLYTLDMTKEQALNMWRRVRTQSTTGATYLMHIVKGPDEESMTYQKAFFEFSRTASFEEKSHFASQLCPSNAPMPRMM